MPVGLVRSENLPSISGVENPFMPRSTMNPRTFPSSAELFAHTTAMSANGEFEIHVLDPFKT